MRAVLLGSAAILVALLLLAARPAPETEAERIDRLTAELRCPVCQGLSVRDSPSETARAMRDIVVERARAGRSDQQIRDEFRASYGDWVVLDPPLAGATGLVWALPMVLLAAGIAVAWGRARAGPPPAPAAPPADVAALRARVAAEEAEDR